MTGAHVSEHATLQITNYTSLDNRDRRMYAGLLGVQSVKKGNLDFVFIVFMFYGLCVLEYGRSRIVVIPTRWSKLKAFAFFLDFDRCIVVGVFVVVVVVKIVVADCILVVVVVVVVFVNVWAPRYS